MLGQIEASVIHNWELRVHFKVSHAKKWLQDFQEDQTE